MTNASDDEEYAYRTQSDTDEDEEVEEVKMVAMPFYVIEGEAPFMMIDYEARLYYDILEYFAHLNHDAEPVDAFVGYSFLRLMPAEVMTLEDMGYDVEVVPN